MADDTPGLMLGENVVRLLVRYGGEGKPRTPQEEERMHGLVEEHRARTAVASSPAAVTDPTTSAGDAVLVALHRLQAELATAAMDGPGLEVVLPNAAFDALTMLRMREDNQAVPILSASFALNTPSGYMTIRRAEPYDPMIRPLAAPYPKLRTEQTSDGQRTRYAPGSGVAQMPAENRQHLLDQLNAAGLKVVRTAQYGMSGRPPDHVHREEIDVPTKPAVKRLESPNHNTRDQPIDVILLHHTGSNSTHGALLHLCDPSPGGNAHDAVSAHYVISPEGLVWQLVDDEHRAWHAGKCELRGEACDMNGRSIGIELVNSGDGKTPFTDAQYAICRQLVAHLQARYRVPWENVLGHRDVAVPKGRKDDPADNFEWHHVLPHEESLRRGLLQPTT